MACGEAVSFYRVRQRSKNHAYIPAGWSDDGGMTNHRCRAKCLAWMPIAKERCARDKGHLYDHKTRYALDNADAWRARHGYNPELYRRKKAIA
jgi:hypothetical protein